MDKNADSLTWFMAVAPTVLSFYVYYHLTLVVKVKKAYKYGIGKQ